MVYGIIKPTKAGVATPKLATKQTPSSSSKSPRSGSSSDTLTKVMGMVDEWITYRKKLVPGWERDNKLYNNERYKMNFEGITDTFVPMTFSTIETLVSALCTGDLSTQFIPQDIYEYLKDRLMPGYKPEMGMTEDEFLVQAIATALQGGIIEDDTLEILNALYDYFWDNGDWDLKLQQFIKSGVKIGNGALWLTWENGKPKLIVVPFPDFVFDPKASDDDSAKFQGRRYLASLSDLRKETIVDPETGKVTKRFNLTGINKKPVGQDEKLDKQLKEEMLFGSTIDAAMKEDPDQVEVFELRTPERQYVIVNRKVIAEDIENPILSQAKLRDIPEEQLILLPGITWANYEDESLLVGKSETSTFWQEQERLNDTTNQKGDAVIRALLQQYQADPQLKPQEKSFSTPGAVIWSQTNQFQAIPPAQVPAAAFNEEVSIKNNIREATATDQIVKGVGSTSDVTATEANLQVAQSGQRIEMKIESLQRGPLKRLARLTLQYIRLFITDPYIIPQAASNGIKPLLFDPKKYNYVFEPKVTLTIQAEGKRKKEQNDNAEIYQMLIQDPTNNLEEVKKKYLPKITGLDKDEINLIMTPAQNQMPNPMQDPNQPQDPNQMPVDHTQEMPPVNPTMGVPQ